MGNKITDELITTVQSIVGQNYSKMDVVRALHMANNDATAAINIIFDTPSFKRSEPPKTPKVSARDSSANAPDPVTHSKPKSVNRVVDDAPSTSRSMEIKVKARNNGVTEVTGSDKWWFVGCSEVAGLSTCKGSKIKAGDLVNFTFPPERSLTGPSPGKFGGGGRGRQPAACSEIVRFSTLASGEVHFWCFSIFLLLRGHVAIIS